MKKILLFSNLTPSPSVINRWCAFADILVDKYGHQVGLLSSVDSDGSLELLQKKFQSVIHLNEKTILDRNISSQLKQRLDHSYGVYNLHRLQPWYELMSKERSNFRQYEFTTYIHAFLEYFENLLNLNGYAIVVTRLIDAEDSLLTAILQVVCEHLNRETLAIDHASIRFHITDSVECSSTRLNYLYTSKRTIGLSEDEHRKTLDGIAAYKKNKASKEFRQIILRSNRSISLFQNFKKSIRRLATINRSKKIEYKTYDHKSSRYVLLLLNKKDNWRPQLISPEYSEPSVLVRNIARTIPTSHSLVVKDHPHSQHQSHLVDWDLIEQCDQLLNVHYIDPGIETFEVIEGASIVFSVASFSGVDALFCLKHLVVFGEKPFFFGQYDSPVKVISNWDALQKVVTYCLNNKPKTDDIMTYIYSFFSVTRSRTGLLGPDDWTDYALDIDVWKFNQTMSMFLGETIEKLTD